MEERVALRGGEKQIYGSQIGSYPETGDHNFMSIVDPENVDIRWSKVGLSSIQEYFAKWGMIWEENINHIKNLLKECTILD